MPRETPLMRQYRLIKKDHQDAILLFHLGDFYEMFFDDAVEASRILNIALTTRDRHKEESVPLCGIPCHAAESYINRLLLAGRKVALCEQVEEASASKGLVRREVTRVITPGTVLDDRLLEGKSNNYLVAVSPGGKAVGLSALDLSTGEFMVLELPPGDLSRLEDRLSWLDPAEVLLPEGTAADVVECVSRGAARLGAPTFRGAGEFDFPVARQALLEHFRAASLEAFGCDDMTAGLTAAGALLSYARETQHRPLHNVVRLVPLRSGQFMHLDSSAQRNLELVASLEDGKREGSLLGVLDRTVTAMGGRKLRSWILAPLTDRQAIERRLDAVASLVGDGVLRRRLRGLLKDISDLERIGSRISLHSGTPRDLAALRDSLRRLPSLGSLLQESPSSHLASLARTDPLADVRERIEERLVEEPPLRARDGGLIRDGFDARLDELKGTARDAKVWLADFEKRERERTGIPSLKVGFNKIHGYYIEVTKANIGSVPPDYTRRQTLVNAERFQCPEIGDFENRIAGAEERITAMELSFFEELRAVLAAETGRIQDTAAAVATADVLQSFAEAAVERGYCRPVVDESRTLEIIEGRHPVVELAGEERFVPNDCALDAGGRQMMIITGPNMAGKSTYLRQVALISLMAQIGGFVPARKATVGIVDRIFTRIGASDRLSRGQSTFMVEMIETASILRNATDRSLVILDEVGRGTSTFDGLSIAWAIAENLHGPEARGPRTLFATHYHQLTELPLTLPRAENFNIAVREWEGSILFLRKIIQGGADRSYGIQVAQLAGLPPSAISRAKEILRNLEEGELDLQGMPQLAHHDPPPPRANMQMEFFPSPAEEVLSRLRDLDLESMTPLESFSLLASLKEEIEKKKL